MDGLNQRDVTQAKETHHFQSVTLCLEVTSFWYLSVHPSKATPALRGGLDPQDPGLPAQGQGPDAWPEGRRLGNGGLGPKTAGRPIGVSACKPAGRPSDP